MERTKKKMKESRGNEMYYKEIGKRGQEHKHLELKLQTNTREVCRWLEEGVIKFTEEEASIYLKFFVFPLYCKAKITLEEVTQVIDTYARLDILSFRS